MNLSLASRVEKMATAILSNCETNLNQYDFITRQEGIQSLLTDGKLQTEVFALDGEYDGDGRFSPDERSLSQVKKIFPQEE